MEVGGFLQQGERDWLLRPTNNIAHRRLSVGKFDALVRTAIPRSADEFQAGAMVSVELFIDSHSWTRLESYFSQDVGRGAPETASGPAGCRRFIGARERALL